MNQSCPPDHLQLDHQVRAPWHVHQALAEASPGLLIIIAAFWLLIIIAASPLPHGAPDRGHCYVLPHGHRASQFIIITGGRS